MFDAETVAAIRAVATTLHIDPAALLAIAEVESGGQAFAVVKGRKEPLIRFEGHYFDRRLSGKDQRRRGLWACQRPMQVASLTRARRKPAGGCSTELSRSMRRPPSKAARGVSAR